MVLTSFGLTDPGCKRSENQDRILFDDSLGLYLVCDGIGGRRRGDLAAELATEAIVSYVERSRDPKEVTWPFGYNLRMSLAANRLVTAVRLANRRVWRQSEQSLDFLGMGTTVASVLFDSNSAAIANIGDSRVYLLRGGTLKQLSTDDTILGDRDADEALPADIASNALLRGVLTQAAGSYESVDIHLQECALEEGDMMLVCSDGLYHSVPRSALRTALCESQDLKSAAAFLIKSARDAGGPDNISAVILRITQA